ncbi:hemerythrin domain-containing protein [Sphingomonas xinjiangensis]|uniref:Hemerythrin-like domain-containing protein n=1 Tax=Sphingomonas xinjiangensis TaxID=643568 RepID=A0A840YN24_9SPHN|nr:hemerythrin domain-containing protein [Sphingomonas xinjiangensis]MBB5711466.1 hemerythrin-like domain-containing protein [Sphingomonas xinjiangensis]
MATTTATRDKNGRFKPASDTGKSGNGNLGMMAGAVAGGAALGLLAMLGRKAAIQAPSALAGNWDDALKAEHAATLKVFDAIEATDEKSTMKRGMLLSHLKHALMKHAVEEENVIYPALREIGQQEGADELNKEHGYVKQYLYELENMPNASPEWIKKVRAFRADIEHHMKEEEEHLFPMLRAQLSEEKNKQLTATMNKEGFKVA